MPFICFEILGFSLSLGLKYVVSFVHLLGKAERLFIFSEVPSVDMLLVKDGVQCFKLL